MHTLHRQPKSGTVMYNHSPDGGILSQEVHRGILADITNMPHFAKAKEREGVVKIGLYHWHYNVRM